jgi:hypothetical protein
LSKFHNDDEKRRLALVGSLSSLLAADMLRPLLDQNPSFATNQKSLLIGNVEQMIHDRIYMATKSGKATG